MAENRPTVRELWERKQAAKADDASESFAVPQPLEQHTDLVDLTDTFHAFEAFLPTTGGNRVAAAILAVGAVIADALQRREGV